MPYGNLSRTITKKAGSLKNYIVRIYRVEREKQRKIVGVVEEPEIDGKKAFTNIDELWGILNSPENEREACKGEARSCRTEAEHQTKDPRN
jgi:hypothetical protein